jgi:cytoskeletal protein CcmA (bactofilin family)
VTKVEAMHVLRRLTTAITLTILALLVLAGPVAAGDFRGGTNSNVAEGETVDDDLYIGAATATIAGTVNGDATIAAGTVTVTGTVTGSLNVAGGSVEVLGTVEGAVRVSGGTVRIAGSVGRDVVTFGGTTTIQSGAEIGGDVAGAGGTLSIGGTVTGDVLAGAGSLEITGSVGGSVETQVGELVIGPEATIGGDVTYTSSREARVAEGATITGTIERREPATAPGGSAIADNPIVSFVGLVVGLLLFGWTLLAIRPRLVLGSGETLRRSPLPSLGIGVVGWIGQFILIVVLVICGALLAALAGSVGVAFIVAAIVVLLLLLIGVFVSALPVAMAIGGAILPDRSPYLAYLAGAAILAALVTAAGFVPALGAVVTILVWVLGLGAFLVYAWRTRDVPWTGPGVSTAIETAPAA